MARKYQIFISSSFTDLKEARRELIMSTLREGHIPAGMELFKATPNAGLAVIENEIRDSDIFVVLVGAHLGSRTKEAPDSLAFTEQEYEIAVKHQLPIISFLLEDNEYKCARDEIPSDRREERKQEDELIAFRERVKKRPDGESRIVGFFSYGDLSHLSEQYSRAIADCVSHIEKEGPRGGWVKGNLFDDLCGRIVLDTSVSDNPFFRTLAQQLNKFGTLTKRTTLREHLKEGAAWYFWQRYFSKLYEKKISMLFFESGSSVAYVSREFINCVRTQSDWFYDKRMNERLQIRTNNLLTYLDFLLRERPWRPIDVRLQPHGPFSEDYGATYGVLNFSVQESPLSPKDAVRTRLSAETQTLVDSVIEDFKRDFSHTGLVLMAASGLDTRPESADAPYPGPHVGSYPNMLLKRCLLALPCPKVLFIDPVKWNFDFRFSNCHAVCDQTFPWETVKSSSPMAIALAAENRIRQTELAQELSAYGFDELDLEEVQAGRTGPWSIIAANHLFADYFKVTSA